MPADAVQDGSAAWRLADMPLDNWGVTRRDRPFARPALICDMTNGYPGLVSECQLTIGCSSHAGLSKVPAPGDG